jgi:P27 family predicted phage terminase small subunit
MAGRRPKPSHLKLLQGNPGKRPLNANEPKPPVELPPPPDHLNEAARKEWNRLGPQLVKLNLLSAIDSSAFAGYCVLYSRWVEAEEMLAKTGPVFKAPSGYPQLSPYYTIANQCLAQMRQYLIEFGMSPASRSRTTVNNGEKEDSLEDFLFGAR